MNGQLQMIDYLVFGFYFIVVAGYGYWIYQRKRSKEASTTDFFLAEGSLTWWAIGASLIASNISAEQFIGMSGSGYKMGLAIASYEWMAAATLLIVAIFFLPVYLKNKIYTMPQFLEKRYNSTVSMVMAVFWLLLYIVVNLMSILYLGAMAVKSISDMSIVAIMALMSVFAIAITVGGMKVIGYTDVIQVLVLIIGGVAATYIGLETVAAKFGTSGVMNGLSTVRTQADDHFHMVFDRSNPNYIDLPGLSVLIGGMWIANLNYWGCNQYITQRALGADLKTARSGLLFAAFLKLFMPLIVVLPGIIAFVLHQQGDFQQTMLDSNGKEDVNKAYSNILSLLPEGLKGLSFAALTAAIVASLAGKANSISTIFTLDIYKKAINPNADERQLVWLGRVTVVVAMILAFILALLFGEQLMGEGKQGFQYIQEYTGFVSPGIFAMFILGFFWKGTTSNGALFATIGGFVFSVFLKFLPGMMDLSGLASIGFSVPVTKKDDAGLEYIVYEIPFLDRMLIVFTLCVIGMWIISKLELKGRKNPKGLEVDSSMFKISGGFLAGTLIVAGVLIALYGMFW